MMVAEGLAALNSVKSLYEMIREVHDADDPEKIRVAAAQMFDLALAAREQTALLQEERNAAVLALANFRERKQEKELYELKDLGNGSLAYMLKPAVRGGGPPYWVCTRCFFNDEISIIQPTMVMGVGRRLQCPVCSTQINPASDKRNGDGAKWLD